MDIEEAKKSLSKFINNFEEVQEMYKDDAIQAEIERQCYFEEVPYWEIKTVLAELERQEKIINTMAKDILSYEYVAYMGEDTAFKNVEEVKQYYEKKVR